MFDSEAVANYYIQKSFDEGVELTQMKLLKLVYIAHGWHRGYLSENLINDGVQAWRYGPVIPDLYRKIKAYGRRAIDAPIAGFGTLGDDQNKPKSTNTITLVDKVWNKYSKFTGTQLSALTHQPGTPWDITWSKAGGAELSGATIANELIEQHYKQKIEANRIAT